MKILIKTALNLYIAVIKILALRKQKNLVNDSKTILLTGTFHSMNWIESHIVPLSKSKNCKHVYLVSTSAYPNSDTITIVTPPSWLVKSIGKVPSRLIYFLYFTVKLKPDYVGGFHLLFNGMVSQMAAKLIRSRSLYFCVGGPAEVLGGGINSENRMLGRYDEPDKSLEIKLLEIVKGFDLIVTMGTSAKGFFEEQGVLSSIEVISGGIDSTKFRSIKKDIQFDFIFVGRLAEIKRIDIIIEAVAHNKSLGVDHKVAIVGDGEKREELEEYAKQLGVNENIHFLGKKRDIEKYFDRSKAFILTSDSEGLSLALIEAMMSGLPAIVSNVGDLSDIVEDFQNGFLVDSREPEVYAKKMIDIVSSDSQYRAFSTKAKDSAREFTVENTVLKWNRVLA